MGLIEPTASGDPSTPSAERSLADLVWWVKILVLVNIVLVAVIVLGL